VVSLLPPPVPGFHHLIMVCTEYHAALQPVQHYRVSIRCLRGTSLNYSKARLPCPPSNINAIELLDPPQVIVRKEEVKEQEPELKTYCEKLRKEWVRRGRLPSEGRVYDREELENFARERELDELRRKGDKRVGKKGKKGKGKDCIVM
jgi:hypothetical protein